MVSTQIQLTDAQLAGLRRLSAELGLSVPELIRRGVDAYLESHRRVDRNELISRARNIAGKHSSSKRDISEKHDEYLAEDFS